MDQQVGHAENGIVGVFTDLYVHDGSVLLRDYTVDRQRNRRPLVLLHAPVIVRIQVRHLSILIERDLLEVKSRRIDVRAEDADPFLELLRSDRKDRHRFLHPDCVNLVARLQGFPFLYDRLQAAVAGFLDPPRDLSHSFALGLGSVEEILIILRQIPALLHLFLIVCCPSVVFAHISILSF